MASASVAVYTVVFDDYDIILTPQHRSESIDYICFTNTPESVPDSWEVREMKKDGRSARRASREAKMMPHKFLPEYEYSIYVDGDLHVNGDLTDLVSTYLDDVDIAVTSHPERDCIYEEARACSELGLGDADTIETQMKKYRTEGFPGGFGLSNTHIILRRHNEPSVKEAMEAWWREYCSGSERDQLSFDYAMWSCDVDYRQFRLDLDDSDYFVPHPHRPEHNFWGPVWDVVVRLQVQGPKTTAGLFGLLSRSISMYVSLGLCGFIRVAVNYIAGKN